MILKTIIFILCVKIVLNAPSVPKIDLTKQKEDDIVQKIAIQLLANSEESDENHNREDGNENKLGDNKETSVKNKLNRGLTDSKENKGLSKDSKENHQENTGVSKDSTENHKQNVEDSNKKELPLLMEHDKDREEINKKNVHIQETNNDHSKDSAIEQESVPKEAKSRENSKNKDKNKGAVKGSKRKAVDDESSDETAKSYEFKVPNGSPRLSPGSEAKKYDNYQKVNQNTEQSEKVINDESSVEFVGHHKLPNNMGKNTREIRMFNDDEENVLKNQRRDKRNEKSYDNKKKQSSKKQPNLLPIRVLKEESKLEEPTKKNILKLKLKSKSNEENTNIMSLKSRENRQRKEEQTNKVKSAQSRDSEAESSNIQGTVLNEPSGDNVTRNVAKADSQNIQEGHIISVDVKDDVGNNIKITSKENKIKGIKNENEEKIVTETSTDKIVSLNAAAKNKNEIKVANINDNDQSTKNDLLESNIAGANETAKSVKNAEYETTTEAIGNEYPLSEVREGNINNVVRSNNSESIVDKTFISMTLDDGPKSFFRLNPDGDTSDSSSIENTKVLTESNEDQKLKDYSQTNNDNAKTEKLKSDDQTSLNVNDSKDNLNERNNNSNITLSNKNAYSNENSTVIKNESLKVEPITQNVTSNSLHSPELKNVNLDLAVDKIVTDIDNKVTTEKTVIAEYLKNENYSTATIQTVNIEEYSTVSKMTSQEFEETTQGYSKTIKTSTNEVKPDLRTDVTTNSTPKTDTAKVSFKEDNKIASEVTKVDTTTKLKLTKEPTEFIDISNTLTKERNINHVKLEKDNIKPVISEKATTVYQSRRTVLNAETSDKNALNENEEYTNLAKLNEPILRHTKANDSKENNERFDKDNNFHDKGQKKNANERVTKKGDDGYRVFEVENSPYKKLVSNVQTHNNNDESEQFENDYYYDSNYNKEVNLVKSDFNEHFEEKRKVNTKSKQENIDYMREGENVDFVIPNHIHASSESKMMKIRQQGDKFFKNKIVLPDDLKPLKLETTKKVSYSYRPKYRGHRSKKKQQVPISEYLSIAPNYLTKNVDADNSLPDIIKYNKKMLHRAMNEKFENDLRTDDEVDTFEEVMKDMVEIDFEALEEYDWLGSTVDIRSALNKLIYIADAITNEQLIHPSDRELFKYVVYVYIVATNTVRSPNNFDNYVHDNYESDNYYEDDNRYTPDYDGHLSSEDRILTTKYFNVLETLRFFLLPRNKRKKDGEKIRNPLAMVDAVFRNILRNDDIAVDTLVVYGLKEFLIDARDELNHLHRAIKEIVTNSNYNDINIYHDLRRGYLKVLNKRKILQIVLHLTLHRTLGLIEDSASSGLERNFKRYLQTNEKEVSRTIDELKLVLKLVNTIKFI